MTSATSVFAGTGLTEGYNLAQKLAEVSGTEDTGSSEETLVVAADGMVEHYVDVEDLGDDIIVISDSDYGVYRPMSEGIISFYWTVNPNTRHVTSEFKVKAGEVISASVVVKQAKNYLLGIMDDDGHARYVTGYGAVGHVFSISTTNRYRVFVQNDNDVALTASGSYYYTNSASK